MPAASSQIDFTLRTLIEGVQFSLGLLTALLRLVLIKAQVLFLTCSLDANHIAFFDALGQTGLLPVRRETRFDFGPTSILHT